MRLQGRRRSPVGLQLVLPAPLVPVVLSEGLEPQPFQGGRLHFGGSPPPTAGEPGILGRVRRRPTVLVALAAAQPDPKKPTGRLNLIPLEDGGVWWMASFTAPPMAVATARSLT